MYIEDYDFHKRAQFGANGHDVIDDTNVHTGPYYFITFPDGAEIDAVTFPAGHVRGGTYAARTMPAGSFIMGTIETIKLTSGWAQAFRL